VPRPRLHKFGYNFVEILMHRTLLLALLVTTGCVGSESGGTLASDDAGDASRSSSSDAAPNDAGASTPDAACTPVPSLASVEPTGCTYTEPSTCTDGCVWLYESGNCQLVGATSGAFRENGIPTGDAAAVDACERCAETFTCACLAEALGIGGGGYICDVDSHTGLAYIAE
jgi:hypothetical protein